jgi:hypothetical protein
LPEAILSVHILGMELNLNRFSNYAMHVCEFGEEDGSVV